MRLHADKVESIAHFGKYVALAYYAMTRLYLYVTGYYVIHYAIL